MLTPSVQLHLGDCLEFLKTLEPGSVDAVVTDPPYMLGSAATRRSADKPMGWSEVNNAAYWYSAWMKECWRSCSETAPLWIFANLKLFSILSCAAASIGGMRPISTLVWDREWPSVGSTRGLRSTYELCNLYGKGDFSIADRTVPDIWRCKWGSHKPTGHPSEKPVDIVQRMIEVSGLKSRMTILDPFMGSGTTGVACVRAGLNFIGCEIDPGYFAIAEKRIAAERASLSLFDAAGIA